MGNLTRSQLFQIAICVLGVLVTSTGQLTDLFGPQVTKYIVSAAGMCVAALSGVGAILTGQGQQVEAVQNMPGIEKITVNKDANAALATLAVDPANLKIEPTLAAQDAVEATAKAAT